MIAAGPDGESDSAVVVGHAWLAVAVRDGQEIAPPPQVMAFSIDKLPRWLPSLLAQLRPLVSNPVEFRNGIGSRDIRTRLGRCDERHAAVRWMYRQVDVPDV